MLTYTPISQLPTRIPSRLTYRIASDPIYITIPEADPKLVIRLHGAGLNFDPPVLTFANSSRVSFRVTGTLPSSPNSKLQLTVLPCPYPL